MIQSASQYKSYLLFHYGRDGGIHIFSVGIGLDNVEEIFAVSSQPGEQNTFLVDNFDDLEALQTSSQLVSVICEGKIYMHLSLPKHCKSTL